MQSIIMNTKLGIKGDSAFLDELTSLDAPIKKNQKLFQFQVHG